VGKVEASAGRVLFDRAKQPVVGETVLEPQIARAVTSILSDNGARAPIFGANSPLQLGERSVAAKTGTAQEFRDGWTIGYTPSLVAGVWVGNNDNTPMKKKADGSAIAAPIWNAFMKGALEGAAVESFTPPPAPPENLPPILSGKAGGQQIVKIDRASGKRATERTPVSFIEEKTFSDLHSILQYVNKDDPRGPSPTTPSSDPEYQHWEDAIARWAKQEKIALTLPPPDFDDLHIPENVPTLAVNSPAENEQIQTDTLQLAVDTRSARGVRRIEIRMDDALLQTIVDSPVPWPKIETIALPPNLETGFHTLTVRAYDDIDNVAEIKRTVNVLRQ
jgi:membrane peptidoglycan carboxypeptidase